MNRNIFLKACWKDNIKRDYSRSSLEATVPQDIIIIRELTEITAPAEVILLMIMATFFKGVCVKILHRRLVKCLNERDPERTDRERVIMIRAICDLPIDSLSKMLVIVSLVIPGAFKLWRDERWGNTHEGMTPPPDTMTPSQEPSQIQTLVTTG